MTTRTTAWATQQQAPPDWPTAGPGWVVASYSPAAPSTRPPDEGRNLAFMDPASPDAGPDGRDVTHFGRGQRSRRRASRSAHAGPPLDSGGLSRPGLGRPGTQVPAGPGSSALA